MPDKLKSPEYPDGMRVLKVGPSGHVKPLNRTKVQLSKLLAGDYVGILESGESTYQIFYGSVMLATVSLHGDDVRVERVR